MIVFPPSLPQLKLAAGTDVQLGDNVRWTRFDSGPLTSRSDTTAREDVYKVAHGAYTRDQARDLRTFYKETIGGALSFEMQDPIFDELATFKFREPPVFKPLGAGKFAIAATMVRLQ